jgi:hypothetical protein
MWDALHPHMNKSASRDSSRFRCTANHTHFSHPTAKRKDFGQKLFPEEEWVDLETDVEAYVDDELLSSESNDVLEADMIESSFESDDHDVSSREDSNVSTGDDIDNGVVVSIPQQVSVVHTTENLPTPASAPSQELVASREAISNLQKEVDSLKSSILHMQTRNRQLARQNKILKIRRNDQPRQLNQTRKDYWMSRVSKALNGLFVGRGNLKDESLVDFIWHHSDGTLQPYFLKLARQYFRANVFTPYKSTK